MTYVKTADKTKESGDWENERHEWFVMYLSNQVLEPLHSGCSRSGDAAQIVMKPEFYEKEIFREDFVVSLIGEAREETAGFDAEVHCRRWAVHTVSSPRSSWASISYCGTWSMATNIARPFDQD